MNQKKNKKEKKLTPIELDRIKVVENISDYENAKDYWSKWISDAEESYQFVRGIQWSANDMAYLNSQNRPALTYNLVLSTIMAASGTMRLNRFSTIYIPQEEKDMIASQILTKVGRHIDYINKMEFVDALVYTDALITGCGWFGMDISYEQNPYGDIIINHENPLHIFLDPNCQRQDIKDADYIIKVGFYTKNQLKMIFGNKSKEIDQLRIFQGLSEVSDINDRLDINRLQNDYVDLKTNSFMTMEKWYWKVEEKNILFDTVSRAWVLEDSEEAEDLPQGDWIKLSKNVKRLWVRSSVMNTLLQDKEYDFDLDMLPFVPAFGYKINREHFGLVENIKDPQIDKNKRRSTMLDSLTKSVNNAVIAEEGSIDKQYWQDEKSKPGAILTYEQGRQIPQFIKGQDLHVSHLNLEQLSTQDIRDISGVNLNVLGQKEAAAESGILFEARVRQGNVQQQPLIDNFRYAKNLLAELKLKFIQNIYDKNEFIRIIGDDPNNPEFVEINTITQYGKVNDIVTGKYDAITTESFSSPTARRFSFMMLLELAKLMPPELVPYHLIIDSSDVEKREEWKQFIQQKLGIQPQMQGQMPIPVPQGQMPQQTEIPPQLMEMLQSQPAAI